tara:strand:- start:1970 stop:2311 length:342 start_codon:yes stop_codon:yes gene_type:complete
MVSKLSSASTFKYPVNNITKIETDPVVDSCALDDAPVMSSPNFTAAISRTMVLVKSQAADMEMCSTGEATPMLKSLEWKPIEEVGGTKGATMLCMQDDGQLEVANGFFLMEMK